MLRSAVQLPPLSRTSVNQQAIRRNHTGYDLRVLGPFRKVPLCGYRAVGRLGPGNNQAAFPYEKLKGCKWNT